MRVCNHNEGKNQSAKVRHEREVSGLASDTVNTVPDQKDPRELAVNMPFQSIRGHFASQDKATVSSTSELPFRSSSTDGESLAVFDADSPCSPLRLQ